jgi:Holliday junction resolvase-like predicted endonuclease
LRPDFQLKLLELTSQTREIAMGELVQKAQAAPDTVVQQAEMLYAKGLATYSRGKFSLDSRQRIMLAEHLIRAGHDPKKVSRYLKWQEFENFSLLALEENGFRVAKHLVFKTRSGRREIDIVAWNDTFLFAIDCKHWLRGLSNSKLNAIVRAQAERAKALAARPELLVKLGIAQLSRRRIAPVIVTLGDPARPVVDRVPVVSVSKFMSFLYGISPADARFLRFSVKNVGTSFAVPTEPKP